VAPSPANEAVRVEATDPVCGMTVAVAGALHFADLAGRRSYFCCAACRQKFLADPAQYQANAPAHLHGA
jgi:YHS domain-containing protein